MLSAVALSLSLVSVVQTPSDFQGVYDALRDIGLADGRVAAVHNLVLRRDAAEFTLRDGSLQFLTPVGGKVVGAVFVGVGFTSISPPLAIERAQLKHVLGDSVLVTAVSAVVFLFADSTPAELARLAQFGAGATDADAPGAVHDALEFLIEHHSREVDPTFMTALLERRPNGYFAAFLRRPGKEDLMIKVDPYALEEVSLLRRGKFVGQRVQTVSQFERAADIQGDVDPGTERPEPLQIEAYRLDATIVEDLGYSAKVTVRFAARRDSVGWVRLLLFPELDVDSVRTDGGAPVPFFRAHDSPDLWVRFDPPIPPGETRSTRIAYHGKLLGLGSLIDLYLRGAPNIVRTEIPEAADRWFYIKSTSTWYPRYSFWQASDMDMTFHTPTKYRFASIGRLQDSSVVGRVRTTHWVTEIPTQQASFNIGEFAEFEVKDPRIPPVTVHMNKEAHRYLARLFLRQDDPERQVASDVANSLAFFTDAFGPPLFTKYYATEIPFFHGQAFPGLIHLSWATFQSVNASGSEESFRAHEMAHQWWGIGVEPVQYRDAWLSEGFAEFAALWYMQTILHDNEKYFRQLRETRDAIRGARDKAPPIRLGYRIAETDPEDYDLTVYRKGAWVLHMLRNFMLNTRTMNEDAFTATMRDFYQEFRGRRASTRDFQNVVERHTAVPMDWFFAQWVDGTAVPTYTLSWRSDLTPSGQYVLRIRVRQENVPPTFVMPVPLEITFADSSRVIVRVTVRGPLTEAEIPTRVEAKRLELNVLESVLAEVKQEAWR